MSQLQMGRHVPRCPLCHKLVCLNEEDARMLARKYAKKHGHYNEIRVYRCPQGPWHWSSMLEIPARFK